MRCATIFVTSFALLFNAADALAQDPLTAASRDAQHLAECTKSLDAYCVASLDDAKSYELLNRKQQNRFSAELNAKDLARYFDSLRRKGVRYTHFETSPPRE